MGVAGRAWREEVSLRVGGVGAQGARSETPTGLGRTVPAEVLGDEDLTLGSPPSAAISSGPWHWDDCHGHHHYEAYARYDLYDVAGDTSLAPVTDTVDGALAGVDGGAATGLLGGLTQ